MPALNFNLRFADAVENGTKAQTIRAPRKRPFKVGDTLYLYTGMRTKWCRKLGEGQCVGVCPIIIDWNDLIVDGVEWYKAAAHEMANQDGFANYEEMADWFNLHHGLPFTGVLIQWAESKGGSD